MPITTSSITARLARIESQLRQTQVSEIPVYHIIVAHDGDHNAYRPTKADESKVEQVIRAETLPPFPVYYPEDNGPEDAIARLRQRVKSPRVATPMTPHYGHWRAAGSGSSRALPG